MLESVARIITSFAAEAYYVGGCVRDCLLGRPIKDVDIVVTADPRMVGEAVREALGGHFFWLRERDETARVIRREPEALQVDLLRLDGPIEADLRRRDYTVNAMAIPVAAGLRPDAPVVDPTGGRADLQSRCLRLAGPDALAADPLRALRGVRLALQLGFTLEDATAARLREAGPWLTRVSAERIRDEFFLCLGMPESAAALRSLDTFGLLPHVLPELTPVLAGAAWEATLAHVTGIERLVADLPFPPVLASAIRAHLERPLTPPRERTALLRFGALLWRLPRETGGADQAAAPRRKGTPLRKVEGESARIGRRLALSSTEAAWVARVLAHRETPRAWAGGAAPSGRAVYQFWRAAGDAAADVLLLALADPGHALPADRLSPPLSRLLEYERGEHPPLLTGQDVMAITGLAPGPAVGHLLEALAEAQADAEVQTREEAERWVRQRKDGC